MDKEIKNEFEKVHQSIESLAVSTAKSIEDLAATTAHGFKEADKKIAGLATTIDDLAAITARGFEQVDKRFEQVDKRFEKIEGTIGIMQDNMDQLSSRLSSVGHEVAEIHKNLTYRDEFDDLMGRMKYVEIRLGIESGK